MLIKRSSFKSGAASFYIVAISTLILVILAASFATAIISEIVRSSNDDLAQSAYDSAMAGVEEARLAYDNYRNCINMHPDLVASATSLDSSTDAVTCQDIVYWATHPDGDPSNPSYNGCDMVALILGRTGKSGSSKRSEIGEVSLDQTSTGRSNFELDQAYTCVKFYIDPQNEYGKLKDTNPYKIVKLKTNVASTVDTITLRWHMNDSHDPDLKFAYTNVIGNNETDSKVAFGSIGKTDIPTPATIAFQIIQTPNIGFTFDQLNGESKSNTSDHVTMFFVPTDNKKLAKSTTPVTNTSTYIGLYDESIGADGLNLLSANQLASTNNHEKNYPYLVYCDSNKLDDFACSVEMELPKPVGGNNRANETFSFIVSLPYGGPPTTFSVDFTCNGQACVFTNEYKNDGTTTVVDTTKVVIDSTGRANDMYKRVEVALDTEVSAVLNGYPFYAIQADTIEKNFSVNTEWGVEIPEEPEPEPADSCPTDAPYMQDWNRASSLAMGETIYLRDKRDDKCYTVAKISDGKVWMTTNLDLAGGTKLYAETTNVPNVYPNGQNYYYQLPASSMSGFNETGTAYVYNSNNTTCDGASPCYSYYSYIAAAVGVDTSKGNAVGDICPSGWRLPTKAEFDNIKSIYTTVTSLTAKPFSATYAGTINSDGYVNSFTHYWSSTIADLGGLGRWNSYNLLFSTSDSPSPIVDYNTQSGGFSIRCVYKK